MIEIVKARNVGMKFKAVEALADVSLDVAPGEQVALLGHNGAGKTTLFRLILGFIKPTSGSISIAGFTPGSDAARRVIIDNDPCNAVLSEELGIFHFAALLDAARSMQNNHRRNGIVCARAFGHDECRFACMGFEGVIALKNPRKVIRAFDRVIDLSSITRLQL